MISYIESYNFNAGCHNIDVKYYKFFKKRDIFIVQNFKRKDKIVDDTLKSSDYVIQSDEMVCSTSNFLQHGRCTKNFASSIRT